MIKPIFTVGIPKPYNKEKSLEELESVQKILERKFTDYHILVYFSSNEEVIFNCFYEKDFNEVKFEELKKIVYDATQN